MRLVLKHRYNILVGFLLVIAYFVTRLLFLTKLPIFTDEAIYIRWAQVALHDSSWRFISLTDGKPPMQTWIMMLFLKVIQDPLLAGRLSSVLSGFFGMIGVGFLGYGFFKNTKIALISSLLYIFYPLALLHDRLAIEDSLSAMWYVWALYFSLILFRKVNLKNSYNLGFILGCGALTKAGAFISMALMPFMFIIFDFSQKGIKNKILRAIGYGLISVLIGMMMYSILRLSPLYGTIGLKDTVFIYPLKDWLSHTLLWKYQLFTGNIQSLILWFVEYFNVSYMVFLLVGLISISFWREKLVLLVYFAAPFVFDAMFGKVIFPRYILFMTVVLLPIAAYGIWRSATILIKSKEKYFSKYLLVLTIIAILPTFYVSIYFITDPVNAPIPQADKNQYVLDWPAGWGVKESIQYLKNESMNQHIFVATQGTFGLMPFAFEMYFYNDPNVTTKAYWPIQANIPNDLALMAKKMPTYVYFYEPCPNCPTTGVAPADWPVTPVYSITKNDGKVHATLYKVLP